MAAHAATAQRSAHALPALGAVPDRFLGRVVGGRYRLEALIAQGGMGRIYRATQLALGRPVAVKILAAQGDAEAQEAAAQRFVFEAAAAAKLHHPHSVTVLDYGTDSADGTAFLVMELLHGRTLGQLLRHEGRLEVYRALAIAKQAAAALCAAHAQNIVHRDLKPGNLFLFAVPRVERSLEPKDYVKVVDFGLAKPRVGEPMELTVAGSLLGSPGYMAPEQIRGESTDHRCDIYALGAILFEMLTGCAPYLRACVYETMVAQVHEPLPTLTAAAEVTGVRQNYGAALEQLVRRAMAKAPQDRFHSMADLHGALTRLMEGAALGPKTNVRPLLLHKIAHGQGDAWVEVTAAKALGHTDLHQGPPPFASMPPWVSPPRPLPRALGVVGLWGRIAQVKPRRPAWFNGRLAAALLVSLCAAALVPRAARVTRAASAKVIAARAPVMTQLDSVPQGATVWLGRRQLCQKTPCMVQLRRPVLRRHVSLRFVHPAFEEFIATRKLSGPKLAVTAVLDGGAEHCHEHLHQDEPNDGYLDAHGLL